MPGPSCGLRTTSQNYPACCTTAPYVNVDALGKPILFLGLTVLDRVEIDTLADGRIKILAIFAQRTGRGEWY